MHDLEDGIQLVVGRSQDCDICIDHASVSRRHLVVQAGQRVVIEDLGSANGTRLGGEELAPRDPTVVPHGSLLEVGSAMLVIKPTTTVRPQLRRAEPTGQDREAPVMSGRQLRRLVELVAPTALNVTISGESGAGKGVVARRIHEQSPRRHRRFQRVDCAAGDAPALERELLGAASSQPAIGARTAVLAAANGGTLLLDEVAGMPLVVQDNLLRALERGELPGPNGAAPLDVRVVATTAVDLRALVARGAFRAGLHALLDGVTIRVPPLRERHIEIGSLASELVAMACARVSRPALPIADAARTALERYGWPGNIRELRNVMERAVALCTSAAIGPEHLIMAPPPPPVRATKPLPPPRDDAPVRRKRAPSVPRSARRLVAARSERARIVEALKRTSGNQTKAAALLGMSRRKLSDRLDELGLPRPRKKKS